MSASSSSSYFSSSPPFLLFLTVTPLCQHRPPLPFCRHPHFPLTANFLVILLLQLVIIVIFLPFAVILFFLFILVDSLLLLFVSIVSFSSLSSSTLFPLNPYSYSFTPLCQHRHLPPFRRHPPFPLPPCTVIIILLLFVSIVKRGHQHPGNKKRIDKL